MASPGDTVSLDASGSNDPDAAAGSFLTYAWMQTAGPAVTLSSPSAAQAEFSAPAVSVPTVLGFTLTVASTASDSMCPR